MDSLGDRQHELLGKALRYPAVTLDVVSGLREEWITDVFLRKVLRALGELIAEQRSTTQETVATRLMMHDTAAKAVKLNERLAKIAEQAGDSRDWKDALEAVQADHARRQVRSAFQDVEQKILQLPTAAEIAEVATTQLLASLSSSNQEPNTVDNREGLQEWVAQRLGDHPFIEYSWPFSSWNTNKIRPGNIILMGAYSGQGKSWLGLEMLEALCGRSGLRTAVFSLEMAPDALHERLIQMGGFKRRDLRPENFSWNAVEDRVTDVLEWPFKIFQGRTTAQRIIATLLRAKAEGNPFDHVLVDHTHLLDFGSASHHNLGIADAMRDIRSVANTEGTIFSLLAQLRKPPGGLTDYRPRMADIRDASALAEICDFIMMLMRKATEDGQEENPEGSIWCEKTRSGRKFPMLPVMFHPQKMRFVEMQKQGVFG